MTASASDSQLLPPKQQKARNQTTTCETLSQYTKLLALAEEVAHFGSWEFDVSKPRAVWSPELFRIFGIAPKEQGLNWEEYQTFIHPDDLESAAKNMAIMLAAGLNHKENFDYRIIRRDGSVRTLHSERQVREVEPDGKAKVIVGVDQDVTEEKQAEEALRRSEERFRAVAEAANVMVYETDVKTGKITPLRGAEELVGYKLDEIDFTTDWVLRQIHPDDVAHVQATLRAAIADPNKDKYSVEYRFRCKKGTYVTLKDTAKAVKDRTGKTVLFIGGVRDITRRKRDQEKIKQYSKHLEELVEQRTKQLQEKERLAAIGETAGMVGHDIRNPLQALAGDVYLIKTEVAAMPENQAKQNINESLESIETGIGYINKIVADLQDYSRPLHPEIKTTDLTNLIAQVFKTITVPNNIKLIINVDRTSNIRIDPILTRRALTNLINNAIQAMPNGGDLTITAHPQKGSLNIQIADTGAGIPDEVRAKVFTPMFTTKAKGQGLGLAVVKRLVEAQDGSISFESALGKGTMFQIILPLKEV